MMSDRVKFMLAPAFVAFDRNVCRERARSKQCSARQ